ncbi:MAG: GntR family transcriptional regulator [Dysosmobacter welbionis]
MRTYALENRGRAPLYEYLYRCIRGDILDGTLTAGERLPSKRALAEHLHISVMTVEGAYQQLEAEGSVYTSPSGAFLWRRWSGPGLPSPLLRLLRRRRRPRSGGWI